MLAASGRRLTVAIQQADLQLGGGHDTAPVSWRTFSHVANIVTPGNPGEPGTVLNPFPDEGHERSNQPKSRAGTLVLV